MGAGRIIAMSRHAPRQTLAREFGATDIVAERGDAGIARIKELTNGLGADSALECVGTQESMMQAIPVHSPGRVRELRRCSSWRPGRWQELFFSHVHLHGGPAPVRRYLPELIDLVWKRKINPGKVFDLTLPLEQVARVTARWMSVARSRRCCVHDATPLHDLKVLNKPAGAERMDTHGRADFTGKVAFVTGARAASAVQRRWRSLARVPASWSPTCRNSATRKRPA